MSALNSDSPDVRNPGPSSPGSRWNDAFLNSLRTIGDPLADAALAKLLSSSEPAAIGRLFNEMDSNNEAPPVKQFPILAEFFAATNSLPPGVDGERILRGENVFMRHPFDGALALLTKCLAEGFAAPNLAIILNISGQLRTHPYRRLLATLQTVVNVSTCHGFQDGGRAVITAQKLRLLHAGVRHVAARARPDFSGQYGVPVNQEDMLATVMGFSLLVIRGWRILGLRLSRQEEEDFLYLWLVFAHMMGIHPEGRAESLDHLPVHLDDATAFYTAFEKRHYVEASMNPDGLALASANLVMLEDFVPGALRLLGWGVLPRLYMNEMMGKTMCSRLDISPVHGHPLIKFFFETMSRVLALFDKGEFTLHERLGRRLFQDLITRSYGGEVTFTLPTSLNQLRSITDRMAGSDSDPVKSVK